MYVCEMYVTSQNIMGNILMLSVGVVSMLYPCPLVAMNLHAWRGGWDDNDPP